MIFVLIWSILFLLKIFLENAKMKQLHYRFLKSTAIKIAKAKQEAKEIFPRSAWIPNALYGAENNYEGNAIMALSSFHFTFHFNSVI